MGSTNQTILSFGKNNRQVLNIVGAVLAFLVTLYSLYHMVSLWDYMGYSYYSDGLEIAASLCWYLYCFLSIVGFCAVGVILLAKSDHILLPIGATVIAVSCLFLCIEEFFYFLWQIQLYYYFSGSPYIAYIFLNLLTLLGWALPAAAGFIKDKALFQRITLAFLILPAAIFLLDILITLICGGFSAGTFFISLFKSVIMVVIGLTVLCNDGVPAAAPHRKQPRPGPAQTAPGAQTSGPARTAVPGEKDYSIGIVLFIVLCIVTFGIYVFIWIYRVSEYLGKVLGREQFSPGVEVVLCLFVPFYIIYWVYKQSKGLDEAHRMRGNYGNTDLSIVSLLLTIFGLGIVAYALMQDQVNKLYNGYVAPAYGAAPNGYAQPQNNSYAQPQNNGYAQPQNNGYAQPQSGGYAQPQSGDFAQPSDTEPLQTEADLQAEAADLNAQAENLKLLKKLLDEGILTPEEFEAKKKDILGL
ncbi:MAG: DUF4234 domain-containing protein [Clostridia bacterium]